MTARDWASSFWITLVDEQGDTFYANPATGERRWLLEPGKIVLPTAVDGQWYELFSDEYDLPYYFHSKTQETRWYRPDGFIIPLRVVQETSREKSARFSIDGGDGRYLDPAAPQIVLFDKPLPVTPQRRDTLSSQSSAAHTVNQESDIDDSTPVASIRDSDVDDILEEATACLPSTSQDALHTKLVERSPLALKGDARCESRMDRAAITLEDFLASPDIDDSGIYIDAAFSHSPTSPRLTQTFHSITRSLSKGLRKTRSTSGLCSPKSAFRPSEDTTYEPKDQGAVSPPRVVQPVRKLKKSPPGNTHHHDNHRPMTKSHSTFGTGFLESPAVNDLITARFAARPKTLFARRSGLDHHPIRWQATDLDQPILTLPKQLHWDALQCFTQIQYIMGDKIRASESSSQLDLTLSPYVWSTSTSKDALRLLSSMWTTSNLQDEVYIQLVCQLVDNLSPASTYRGWQLMQVLLVSLPPAIDLVPALRYFFGSHLNFPNGRIGVIARFALRKLDESNSLAPRARLPTLAEIGMMCDAAFQPTVFGETLDRVMSLQRDAYPDAKVPVILSFLADGILALGGLTTFGLFRTQADPAKVAQLRNTINQGTYSFEGFEDPHIAAAALKLWLRELASPVVPFELHKTCVAVAEGDAVSAVSRLPQLNRRVLVFVISFLQTFIHHTVTAHTTVTPAALAMIFTPCLIRSPPVEAALKYDQLVTNARAEQTFILSLIENLDVKTIVDKDGWIPRHGQDLSASQSTNATMSSQISLSSSPDSIQHFEDISHQYPNCPQPSLDSEEGSDTASLASTISGQRHTVRLRVHSSSSSNKSSSSYVDAPEEMIGRRRTMSESDASITVIAGREKIPLGTTYRSPVRFVKPTIVIDEAV